MATSFEELRVLREAEIVADGIWQEVSRWEPFARIDDTLDLLFTAAELEWLQTAGISNLRY